MKNLYYILLLSICCSCNNIAEAILLSNTERVDTIDVKDYKYVIDKKNRRGYVTSENEVMEGTYVVTREGVVSELLTIEGGFLNGERILYYENGQPESIETYKTSVQHGPVTDYYENGAIRAESSYTNGKKNVYEIHYDDSGAMDFKIEKKEGVVYEHSYRNGNRVVSMFQKELDGKSYELMMKYDALGNAELLLGKIANENTPVVYVFDADYNIIDSFNGQEEPIKAQQYFSFLQGLN